MGAVRYKSDRPGFKDGGAVLSGSPPAPVEAPTAAPPFPSSPADDALHARTLTEESAAKALGDERPIMQRRLDELERAEQLAKSEPPSPQPESHDVESTISGLPLSGTSKDWLRNHRDFMTDPRKNAKLQAAHWDATDAGPEGSPAYLEALETSLGMRKKPDPDPEPEPPGPAPVRQPSPPQRSIAVSAPVSRTSLSYSGQPIAPRGKITLSAAENEAAAFSGVSQQEYAAGKIELGRRKASGMYNEGG